MTSNKIYWLVSLLGFTKWHSITSVVFLPKHITSVHRGNIRGAQNEKHSTKLLPSIFQKYQSHERQRKRKTKKLSHIVGH